FGMYFLPEIDTEVIVGSRVGDANSLVVLGGLWNQTDKLPEETAGEKNYVKRIRTKGKHELLFNDDEEKGQLALNTAQKLHITMSEDKKTVVVADAEEKNALVVDGENNTIKLIADKKICFCVGGAEMLVLDGDSKKIQLKADHLEEKGVQDVKLETQKLNIKGEMTELKAGGSFKINSSGIAEIKGAMVKIN
ncbi:MAG: phage baseplate assembly protein V, partial [Lachnospiraceae bacterium]|nr:phage baseplate assembly protein V [Lachnospiraceae bacterium]